MKDKDFENLNRLAKSTNTVELSIQIFNAQVTEGNITKDQEGEFKRNAISSTLKKMEEQMIRNTISKSLYPFRISKS